MTNVQRRCEYIPQVLLWTYVRSPQGIVEGKWLELLRRSGSLDALQITRNALKVCFRVTRTAGEGR
jgi:hypothetical protein